MEDMHNYGFQGAIEREKEKEILLISFSCTGVFTDCYYNLKNRTPLTFCCESDKPKPSRQWLYFVAIHVEVLSVISPLTIASIFPSMHLPHILKQVKTYYTETQVGRRL